MNKSATQVQAWVADFFAKRHNRLWNGGNGIGTIQLFGQHGTLVDRIHAENIDCEFGVYSDNESP